MEKIERLVIVGGNAAGMAAAARARRRRPELHITIVEAGSFIASANCSIPAYLDGRFPSLDSLQNLTPDAASKEHRLNLLLRHQALEIDPRRHQLRVSNLDTNQDFVLPYDRLILATGARPILPSIPNISAHGVFALRSLADAHALRHFLEARRPRKFAVVGTGTIAQVCVAALRSNGLEVSFIARDTTLMADLEENIGRRIQETLQGNGITLYYADNAPFIKVSPDNQVQGLEFGAKAIPCEGILFALGVEPNADLAHSAALALGVNGALCVDRHLTTSRNHIFACGDCAQTFLRLTHKPFYWPLGTTANRQGRQAGENASGGNGQDVGTMATRLWRCFDLQIGRIGLSSKQTQEFGYTAERIELKAPTKAKIYGGDALDLSIVFSHIDGRILGAQLAAFEGVHARLSAIAAAIMAHLTIGDLEDLDFGFTPEISALRDPLQLAGRLGRKRRKGRS